MKKKKKITDPTSLNKEKALFLCDIVYASKIWEAREDCQAWTISKI